MVIRVKWHLWNHWNMNLKSLRPHTTSGKKDQRNMWIWDHSGLGLGPLPGWASQRQSHGQRGIGTWLAHSPSPIWVCIKSYNTVANAITFNPPSPLIKVDWSQRNMCKMNIECDHLAQSCIVYQYQASEYMFTIPCASTIPMLSKLVFCQAYVCVSQQQDFWWLPQTWMCSKS